MTAHDVHLDAEVEAVSAARAILRSDKPHSVGTIRQACVMLQRFGDGTDWLEARQMLRAIEARKPVQKPPMSPQPRLIRRIIDGLLGALITVAVVYVYLLVAFSL
jgi:hypothetical protein